MNHIPKSDWSIFNLISAIILKYHGDQTILFSYSLMQSLTIFNAVEFFERKQAEKDIFKSKNSRYYHK